MNLGNTECFKKREISSGKMVKTNKENARTILNSFIIIFLKVGRAIVILIIIFIKFLLI